jgi:hypothetical protein
MEVGHDDGNLQSVYSCNIGDKPYSAPNLPAQELSKLAVSAESRCERLTKLPL